MKKILLIAFLMLGTGFTLSAGKGSDIHTFESSMKNLKHEADSLNILVKKYNEKTD